MARNGWESHEMRTGDTSNSACCFGLDRIGQISQISLALSQPARLPWTSLHLPIVNQWWMMLMWVIDECTWRYVGVCCRERPMSVLPLMTGMLRCWMRIESILVMRKTPSPGLGGETSNIFLNFQPALRKDNPIWLEHVFHIGGSNGLQPLSY